MHHARHIIPLMAALLAWVSTAAGQAPPVLELQARQALAEAEELAGQMETLDASIERRVQRILDLIAGVRDSSESGTRVVNLKQDLMEGLKSSIDIYQQARAKREAALQRGITQVPRASLEEDLAYLDERTERRVEQIIELSQSLTRHDNFEKYTRAYSGDDRHGGYSQHVSDAYRQSKRQGSKTVATQEALVKGLSEDLAEAEADERAITDAMTRTRTEEHMAYLEDELEKREERIATREAQIDTVMSGPTEQTKQVGSREAHALELQIRDEVEAVQTDFRELVRLKSEFDLAVGRAKSLKTRLSYSEE